MAEHKASEPKQQDKYANKKRTITPEQVTSYLERHADFFVTRSSLLSRLQLPVDDTGNILSFVQYQNKFLQESNTGLQARLDELECTETRDRDILHATYSVAVELLSATSTDVLIANFQEFLRSYFNLVGAVVRDGNRTVPASLYQKTQYQQVFCGSINPVEAKILFVHTSTVKSAVIVRFQHHKAHVFLCAGSKNARYFHQKVDTTALHLLQKVLQHQYQNLSGSAP